MNVYLRFDSAELSTTFSCGPGEKPPEKGWWYRDQHLNEWIIREIRKYTGCLTDPGYSTWKVSIGCTSITSSGIPRSLDLTRKLSDSEIREARQKIQDLGFDDVKISNDNQYLILDAEGKDFPEEVNGIPVVAKSLNPEEDIIKLIKWMDDEDIDHYGVELLDTVLYKLRDCSPEYFPIQFQEALEVFRVLPEIKQHNLVYSTIDAGPLSYGEQPGDRDLLPEKRKRRRRRH